MNDVAGSVKVQVKGDLSALEASLEDARRATAAFDQQASGTFRATKTAIDQLGASTASTSAFFKSLTAAVTEESAAMKSQVAVMQSEATTMRAVSVATDVVTSAHGKAASAIGLTQIQMLELFHVGREIPTMLMMGVSPLRAFTAEFGRLTTFFQYGNGGVSGTLKGLGTLAGTLLARFSPILIAIGGVAAEMDILKDKINETGKQTVSFGNVAVATWDLIKEGLESRLKPAMNDAIGGWAPLWKEIGQIAVDQFNTMGRNAAQFAEQVNFAMITVGAYFKWGYQVAVTAWSDLPDAFGYVATEAANNVLETIRSMTQHVGVEINQMVQALKQAATGTPLQGLADSLPNVNVAGTRDNGPFAQGKWLLPNPYANSDVASQIKALTDARDQAVSSAYAAMNKNVASADNHDFFGDLASQARDLAKAADDAGSSLKKAATDAVDPWAGLRHVSEGVAEQMRALQKEARQQAQFLKGILSTFTNDIEHGKSVWQAFGDAGEEALNKIIGKLEDAAIGDLLGNQTTGGFFSGILKFLGFANGGAFAGGVQKFAGGGAFTNSIVSSPTLFKFANGTGLMGEAGPEGILPLRRNNRGQLGVMASGAAGGGATAFHFAPVTNIDARGSTMGEGQFRSIVQEENQKLLQKMPKHLDDWKDRGFLPRFK